MLVVYSRLEQKYAQKNYDEIKKWFKENPDRKECVTDIGTVRRDHIKEDILSWCVDGVVLKDKQAQKKKVKRAKVQANKKGRARTKRGTLQ